MPLGIVWFIRDMSKCKDP